MNEYQLLENIFTDEQLFLISATSTPEIDIDYTNQTLSFNTTKTYDRDTISRFINTSRSDIETFKATFAGTENSMTETQRTNIVWIEEQLRKLDQYLNR